MIFFFFTLEYDSVLQHNPIVLVASRAHSIILQPLLRFFSSDLGLLFLRVFLQTLTRRPEILRVGSYCLPSPPPSGHLAHHLCDGSPSPQPHLYLCCWEGPSAREYCCFGPYLLVASLAPPCHLRRLQIAGLGIHDVLYPRVPDLGYAPGRARDCRDERDGLTDLHDRDDHALTRHDLKLLLRSRLRVLGLVPHAEEDPGVPVTVY